MRNILRTFQLHFRSRPAWHASSRGHARMQAESGSAKSARPRGRGAARTRTAWRGASRRAHRSCSASRLDVLDVREGSQPVKAAPILRHLSSGAHPTRPAGRHGSDARALYYMPAGVAPAAVLGLMLTLLGHALPSSLARGSVGVAPHPLHPTGERQSAAPPCVRCACKRARMGSDGIICRRVSAPPACFHGAGFRRSRAHACVHAHARARSVPSRASPLHARPSPLPARAAVHRQQWRASPRRASALRVGRGTTRRAAGHACSHVAAQVAAATPCCGARGCCGARAHLRLRLCAHVHTYTHECFARYARTTTPPRTRTRTRTHTHTYTHTGSQHGEARRQGKGNRRADCRG